LTEILRAAKSRLRTVFAATTPAGEHVGFGLIQLGSGENANFTGAVVRKDWREKGLFGKLVEARIRWAVSQNHRTVSVHVLPTSENVIREFEISGRRFVECEREREDVFLYGQNGKKFVIDLTGATI
jgi:GNAT superfamily N-acetyltransferase